MSRKKPWTDPECRDTGAPVQGSAMKEVIRAAVTAVCLAAGGTTAELFTFSLRR